METELRCGRCERTICPRDLVHTPGGTRCPDCALLRRPPMYELAWSHYALAALAGIGAALTLGVAGHLLLPPRANSTLFGLAFALLLGVGAGIVSAEAVRRVTGGKRGLALQLIAAAAVVGAGAVRVAIGGDPALITRDVAGALAVVAGVAAAWGRLA